LKCGLQKSARRIFGGCAVVPPGPRVDMPSVAGTDALFDERLRGMLRERVRDVLAKRFDLAGYVDPK